MRFAKHLRELGDEFREKFLGSTDVNDKTILKEDLRKMKVSLVFRCILLTFVSKD